LDAALSVATPARRLALSVLARLGHGPGSLGDALAVPEIEALGPRERAFLHELVLGTLRRRGLLDHALSRLSDQPLSRSPLRVRDTLRLGAYQLLFLRVPPYAAVSEAVALARETDPQAAGFVNAVLRRLQREGPPPEPDPRSDPLAWLVSAGSLPRWLAERWTARLGAEETIDRARALTAPPPTHFRYNPRVPDAPERARGAGLRPRTAGVPGAWEVEGGRITELAADGTLYVQDQGSQLIAHLAAADGVVLDACAAPGGKALLLADLVGPRGRIVAGEASRRRLRTLCALSARWGATNVALVGADARRPPFARPFDSVLLDAPCSGLGTLARNPDIRWRLRPEDVVRHASGQRELLEALCGLVRPGGRLVYATCSVEDEETDHVLLPFLAAHPEFEPEELPAWARSFAVGAFVRMSPSLHRGDAFFAARLRRLR
jgi:16S rRNA (cytosine967-C5)-methyltransferase